MDTRRCVPVSQSPPCDGGPAIHGCLPWPVLHAHSRGLVLPGSTSQMKNNDNNNNNYLSLNLHLKVCFWARPAEVLGYREVSREGGGRLSPDTFGWQISEPLAEVKASEFSLTIPLISARRCTLGYNCLLPTRLGIREPGRCCSTASPANAQCAQTPPGSVSGCDGCCWAPGLGSSVEVPCSCGEAVWWTFGKICLLSL